MAESRLQRWSRKKTGASKEVELPAAPATGPEPSPQEQELAVNETLPEREVLEKYNLPDPDAIELGTDITGFMRKEIPELLRRRALRSLWRSNPVLAVLDGLNDYDEDFTDAANTGKAIRTLYKVGQGFDRAPKVDEKPVGQAVVQPQEPAGVPEDSAHEAAGTGQDKKALAENPEPETAVEPTVFARQAEPGVLRTEEEPAPRYRPRMRFEH